MKMRPHHQTICDRHASTGVTTVWKRTTRLLIGPLIPDTSWVGSAPNTLILLVTLFQSFLR